MSKSATSTTKTGASPARRPLLRRLALPLLALALALLAGTGGLMAALGIGGLTSFAGGGGAEAAPAPHDEAPAASHGGEGGTQVLAMEEMIVNIAAPTLDGQSAYRFLKLDLALVFDGDAPEAGQLPGRQPYLRDSFLDYLRQLTEADLQGSAGLARLRAELLRRARAVVGTETVQEVLIADLVIQ
ncbi:flagellar basal body-associated FliL family protein [Pseudoroseicyclus aestuarii]|uniref:Flagellar protein FliL n=1 Tax=Pseudoroseicyclus aestuarii TaxID=1795041 RepID=A0A318SVV9_9RHOB|nr:flagellar basal body-associated FliL family protein [Pseudoroseicyclus aestuarii]PYE84509.1 flagellar FliL protein [Pseudoroseicyclus aestuarii]